MSYTSFQNNNTGATQFALLQFRKSNDFLSVGANDSLARILSSGYDAVTQTFKLAAYIECLATGAPSTNVPSQLQFVTTNGTSSHLAMTVGENGQVSIANPATNQATLVVRNDQSTPNINLRTANATPTNAPHIHFTKSGVGIADAVANDELGRLEYFGFQGGTAREAGEITAVAETVNGTNAVSSYLSFRTVPTTYAAMAERMRISADGNTTITTPVSGIALTINGVASGIAAQINNAGTSLDFSSTAQRITADMSNATHANRLAFQTNTVNGATSPFILPNGTSQTASIIACNNSTPANSAFAQLQVDNTSAKVVSGILGTGTLLPLELRVGNNDTAISISTNRAVTINAPAATGQALTVNGFAGTANYAFVSTASVSAGLYQSSRFLNSNTTAGSGCRVDVAVNQQAVTTGGQTFVRFINEGIQAVSVGLNTATQQYVMGSGSDLTTAPFFRFTISGAQINLPLQCCFHAYIGTAQNNVTGAGTYYDVIFQTERYDVSSSYNATNGVFTAPATGKYLFTSQIEYTDITAAMTSGEMGFQVNAASFVGGLSYINVGAAAATGTSISLQNTCLMALTAGDTVRVRTRIQNGAGDTADLANVTSSFFAGQLLS